MHGLGRGQSCSLSKQCHPGKETLVVLESEEFLPILVPFSTVGKDAEVFFIVRILIMVMNVLVRRENSFSSVGLVMKKGLWTYETVGQSFMDEDLFLEGVNLPVWKQHLKISDSNVFDV